MLRQENFHAIHLLSGFIDGAVCLAQKLAAEGELIVTIDNKPFAVMINPGDEDAQI